MKRLLFFLLILWGTIAATAQSHLNVAPFFTERFTRRNDVVSVMLKGRKAAQYRLSLFRSITVPTTPEEVERVERAVRSDARRALQQEAGTKDGRLYYGFYHLASEKHKNTFLFYRNNALSGSGDNTFILIYIEGEAGLSELKRIFGK